MGHILKSVFGLAAVSALSIGFAASAQAGKCRGGDCDYGDEGNYGYVTAHATTGGKTVTAPVRPGRWGEQVKLPGGAWVDCETTCEYTLRRHTVDFWEGMGEGTIVSPGYFRYDYNIDTGETTRRGPAVFGRY